MERINHMDDTLPVTAEVGDEGGSFAEQARNIRYPTERASDEQEREPSGRAWRKGLVGVAAGTAALIGVSKLRRRED